MSDKVKVELNDDLSELLYLKYECDLKNKIHYITNDYK